MKKSLSLSISILTLCLIALTVFSVSMQRGRAAGSSAIIKPNGSPQGKLAPLVGAVTVTATAGTVGPTGYATLKDAFDAINAGTHQGTITVDIVGDTTETVPAVLNANGSGGAVYTGINIQPSGGAARMISGAIALGSPLIDFNGASNVVVDGLNTGSNSLTISNTTVGTTTQTSTIRFINDANNNIVRNSTISGSGTGTATGTILFGTTTGANGNDNNTVTLCNIGPAGANLPLNGVFSLGTTATAAQNNSGDIISSNNIFDFFNAATDGPRGVLVSSGSTDWTITGNSFYQTATRTFTGTVVMRAISIENTSGNNFIITNNKIGGSAANAAGAAWTQAGAVSHNFIGIRISAGTTTATSVQNNTIQNISITNTSTSSVPAAISLPSGSVNVGTTTGNTIGSQSVTGSITQTNASAGFFTGILSQPGTLGAVTISNNTVGGVTMAGAGAHSFRGIRIETGTVTSLTISSNTIGSATTANSIQTNSSSTAAALGISTSNATAGSSITGNTVANFQLTSTGTSGFRGIETTGAINGHTMSNNTIRDVSSASTSTNASSTPVAAGIFATGTSNARTISGNSIFNLSSTTSGATAVNVLGILIGSSGSSGTMNGNLIYNLSTASTSATSAIKGIYLFNVAGTAPWNMTNNMIRLGTGLSTSINPVIRGINEDTATGATNNILFNSIFIGGTQGAATVNTAAVFRAIAGIMDIRNNILWNNRASTGAAGSNVGRHYCIQSAVATGTLTTNFNNLFADANGGAVGFLTSDRITLANWQAAGAGFDLNSFSANPSFVDPSNATTPDLHLQATNPESRGAQTLAAVTTDFDAQTRPQPAATSPDIGADEGDFTLSPDLLAPAISYTLLGNSSLLVSRVLTAFATIVDNSGTVSGGANSPRIYYKKTTDANAIVGNTSADNGWKFAMASNASSPYDFTIDYSIIFGGTVSLGDTIQYFVVAQDASGNVGINSGTFATTPASVVLTTANLPTGTINSYLITSSFAGSYNVGTAQLYTSLTGAAGFFAAINGGVVTGDITVNIVSDLAEDGTNALNQWSEKGGSFTMKIQPDAGTLRTISGTVATGMIRLNGADRVTIDGRFAAVGQFLLFRNTNTSNPTFTFLNDATNNTIRSSIIEGANTSTTSGTILFSTSTGTLGNSSNTINSCDIRDRSDAAGVPANGVYSSGSAGAPNGSNTVSGCNVFNWTNAGVLVSATGAGSGWTVNPSSFYQTAARTTAMTAISIQGGSGHSILNNSIGGTAPLAAGSNLVTSSTFRGIDLTVGTASATSVQGNTIKNIRSTLAGSFTASYGIFLEAGMANIGNVTGNTVGSSNVAERYEISGDSYGIRVVSTSTVNLSNNIVNNMTTAPGVPTGEFYFGISVEGTAGAHTVVNNTVTNLTNGSTPDATFNTQTIGLIDQASGVQTVRGNSISNIGSTDTTVVATLNNRVWGLLTSGTAVGTVVDRNTISNIYASSPTTGARADVITALQSQNTTSPAAIGNGTYTNNMVNLSGGGAPSDRSILGILEVATGVSNYYFNSVNIFGTATAANSTYAFNRLSTATVTIRDNIFANPRTGGTGFHVAFANTNAAATGWSATASNYNLLNNVDNTHLTQWLGALAVNNGNLAAFQAASGGDLNSLTGNPVFVSNTDLHIQATSQALMVGNGTGTGVTTDYDSDPRPASNPDIGADEIVQAVAGTIPAGTFYNALTADGDTLGGNVSITNIIYLNGKLSTGANTLGIGCNASISGGGAANYVIGNLKKTYCAAGNFSFPVGTANGFSPVAVNVTAGTFPADFTTKAVQGPQPNIAVPAKALQRYWTLTASGVTADLTFNYLDPTDIPMTANEAAFVIFKYNGSFSMPGGTVTPASDSATITGVTSFSDWTLAEPSAEPCPISTTPTSQNFPGAGGSNSFTVTADGSCVWDPVPNAVWITIDSVSKPTGGHAGNGTVNYSVAANPGGARMSTITVGVQTFTVTQDTGCSYMLDSMSHNFIAPGGSSTVGVTATTGCAWTAVSNDAFIIVDSGTPGTGNGTVNYHVTANTGPARNGTMTIAGITFNVTQDAACAYMLSSMSQNFVAAGGMNSVDVLTGTGCTWTAVSNDAFITVNSGTPGNGNGTVGYTVAANVGIARMGTMTIAGITFTVTQDGGCMFTLSRDHQSFAGNGGSGSVDVIASDSACPWTASTAATFIHITSGTPGTGNGTLQYTVDANPGPGIRNSTITIAGETYTVYQGIDFLDVPSNALFYTEIGKLAARGVTLGCGGGNYCPDDQVLRDQMAAFIMRAKGEFNPPTPGSQRFVDVPPENVFYNFIDRLAELQITLGCTPTMYCPADAVKREQMAAFIIRGLGEFNPPTPGSQRFVDVPPENPFYKFIDRMAELNITLGCSPTMYCPNDIVTRRQMAAFLVRAFDL